MNVDERWQEVALVDIAYEVLNNNSAQSMNYRDIFKEAARMKGLTDDELLDLLPQVFTEMNLDGRFLCISPSEWGLKKWYTTQAIEESIEALARSKGIDDDDDAYGYEDEEDSDADFTEEDYDSLGDIDEIEDDEDEASLDEEIEEIEEDEDDLDEGLEEDGEFEEDSDFEDADDFSDDDNEDED